jgi:hypothetical protein
VPRAQQHQQPEVCTAHGRSSRPVGNSRQEKPGHGGRDEPEDHLVGVPEKIELQIRADVGSEERCGPQPNGDDAKHRRRTLVSLDNIQEHLENPFDQIGEDDIMINAEAFLERLEV